MGMLSKSLEGGRGLPEVYRIYVDIVSQSLRVLGLGSRVELGRDHSMGY